MYRYAHTRLLKITKAQYAFSPSIAGRTKKHDYYFVQNSDAKICAESKYSLFSEPKKCLAKNTLKNKKPGFCIFL